MTNSVTPILCGGTFLTLVLKAKAEWILDGNGNKITLTEYEVFRRLISVYHLSDFRKNTGNLPSYTSKYKKCHETYHLYTETNIEELMDQFDMDAQSSDSQALRMMKEFVDECIRKGSEENLVSSLLDVIEQDSSILDNSVFYISADGTPTTKEELSSKTSFVLAPFLLGVWHFILKQRANSKRFEDAYPQWVKEINKNGSGITRDINIIPMPDIPPKPEKADRVFVAETPLPLLQSDTHYIILAFRSSYSEGNPVSLSVNVNRLTQNDDQSVMDAFASRTAEMIEQIRTLPCLFSDCGDFDDVGVPYFERDFIPREAAEFAFGYVEDISFAKGKEDILVTVRPRIRQSVPQKELIDNQIHIYTKIGLRYPAPFYCEGLTIVEGNLIAGLRELGIKILDE